MQVYGDSGGPCDFVATVEVNSEWYCWLHDPDRPEKARKRNEERLREAQDKHYRRLAEQDVCKGVSTEELEELGTEGLLYLMDISLRYRNIVNNSKGG